MGADRPKRGQDGTKRATKSFKVPNPALAKTLKRKSDLRFFGFKAVQDSLERPKKAPKRHLNGSKTFKKGIQRWTIFVQLFGQILEPFWGPFWSRGLIRPLRAL